MATFESASFSSRDQLHHQEPDEHTRRAQDDASSALSGRIRKRSGAPREKLIQSVWADTFVTDEVLTRSISELRKVFDDDAKDPRFIQTIPRSGYRLVAPISYDVGTEKKDIPAPAGSNWQKRFFSAVILGVAFLLAATA
ncbi:MAG TPA: winged helix-turn-helix domain-containing protein [Blastocatellia bacterium]|nr:winged helix-turn-helix domain-containing protein [Blastocatellia bacterium]